MGLFDLFRKRKNGEVKMKYGGITFWSSPPITNDEYQRIRQNEIDLLERKYDLSTIKGINAIPVPKHKVEESGGGIQSVTGRIEYYLMHKGGVYEKAGEIELALACYRKANALMPVSPAEYQYDTYMRLPRFLRKLRRFDEAQLEEAAISKLFPNGGVFALTKAEFMNSMKDVGHSRSQAEKLYREYAAERDIERQREQCSEDYNWLWEHMPEICPKSFSGYMRMRNANTDNYQKIKEAAASGGRVLI